MPKIVIDSSTTRHEAEGFRFPLGVYPVEPIKPISGYIVEFESADGDNEADWEEWPDRFVFDIQVTSQRLRPLCKLLFSFLPGRVYPILDVLGNDAYREVDPYIAFELVGIERFFDGVLHFDDWLFEDGLVGFGAMSMNPFFYIFVDEHKAITIRAGHELKERVERALAAFDLGVVKDLAGVDSVAHEHRTVLAAPEAGDQGALAPEEITDWLVENWLLQLNVDPRTNVDDLGRDLGNTAWRMVARCVAEEGGPSVYAEILLVAGCIENAELLAIEASKTPQDAPFQVPAAGWYEVHMPVCDRVTPERLKDMLGQTDDIPLIDERVLRVFWYREDA
ncbi:MAG: hypothetical protein ACNA8P_02100 [Phycisphaerales bacterium]